MSAVCLDAGTTMIKAVRYDDAGREVQVARRNTRVLRPHPGWAEQDMEEVWRAVVEVVREVTEDQERPDFLALTAQGDGAWFVDAAGAPTGPAVLWNDGRAADLVTRWEDTGVLAEAFGICGSRISTGMPNAVIGWFEEHDPGRLVASDDVLTCGGWVFSRLTGRRVVDLSEAAAPFLDIRERAWSDRLLDLYGMSGRAGLLPTLVQDDDRVGGMTGEAAGLLGLPADLPVVLAPYDICATAIGSGAVAAGDACCILGTTLSTETVVDRVPDGLTAEDEVAGITVTLGAPGRWLRAFPTMAGGDVLGWAREMLGLDDVGELLALAETADSRAAGVRFLPYLSPAGERSPFFAPRARGSLTGLSFDAGRADVARAVVDGLTLTIRDCVEAVGARPDHLTLSGGGAASPFWRGRISDVTGLTVDRCTDTEVGARGAHLVGLVATGAADTFEAAAEAHVTTVERREPDPAQQEVSDAAYDAFLRLRGHLGPAWTDVPAAGASR